MASKQKSIFDSSGHDEQTVVKESFVSIEDTIFCRRKENTGFLSRSEDSKIDTEDLFSRYKDIYLIEYTSNIKRLNVIDSGTFNRCCLLLEESRDMKIMNVEAYDIVKEVIKSACTCVEDAFYCYTNMNKALIDLVAELCPSMDIFTVWHVIDRSYAEVIEEFGSKRWQK